MHPDFHPDDMVEFLTFFINEYRKYYPGLNTISLDDVPGFVQDFLNTKYPEVYNDDLL